MKGKIVWRGQISWRTVIIYPVALAIVAYTLAPFGWLVVSSFMTEAEAWSVPTHFLPHEPTLDNYLVFINPAKYGAAASTRGVTETRAGAGGGAAARVPRSILNSAIVASGTAFLNLIFGSMAAYSLARLRFRGSGILMMSYLATRMVPLISVIISVFMVVQRLHLADTLVALIMLHTAGTLPFTVWILKSYFQTIPRELEDAARVDRCGWVGMMLRVFLPLARPGLAAAGICCFIWSWQDFLGALILTNTIASKTAPTIVAEFVSMVDIERSMLVTSGVLAVIPPVVIALLFQRLIVQGLLAGAMKA